MSTGGEVRTGHSGSQVEAELAEGPCAGQRTIPPEGVASSAVVVYLITWTKASTRSSEGGWNNMALAVGGWRLEVGGWRLKYT